MRVYRASIVVLTFLVDIALSNITRDDINTNLRNSIDTDSGKLEIKGDTRRKRKKDRSTSSSSKDAKDDSSETGESLEMTMSSSSEDSDKKKKYTKPKSSLERRGWRKWHRKCYRCNEDLFKKWRDPSIKWICGAYQRARRSFKSLCMMHYRNCQDGTMFVKIHDHRCKNDSDVPGPKFGDHFFYDYKAKLSDESSKSKDSDTTSSDWDDSNYDI